MKLSTTVQGHLSDALRQAQRIEYVSLGCKIIPTGPQIVFRALQEALYTMQRMPDPDAKMRVRSLWPDIVRTDEEREEAWRELQWLYIKGLEKDPYDLVLQRIMVTPKDHAIMDAVLEEFRKCLVGRNVGRDWTILTMKALGVTTRGIVKRIEPPVSRSRVVDIVQLQTAAIASKLIPEVS